MAFDKSLLQISTLGELKKSTYRPRSIKDELRENLIEKIKRKEQIFAGIWGYEETVIPDIERAILSKHHINLLGLRGQAKTRIARLMVELLDEYIPVVAGSELNDDPLQPISRYALDLIAVSLFNILQEGDIQIRGFKLRLPLDIQFVFTANPEDYTNRGSIVTPLKDRIDSQILTHYPKTIEIGKKITAQEAKLAPVQKQAIEIPELLRDLVEQIAVEARQSEYVDAKSGVSARLTISAYENLVSAAERRILLNNESKTMLRIADLVGVIPAITGKIELVYEGEQEGSAIVAQNLLSKAIRTQFLRYFPDPEKSKKLKEKNPYSQILEWFGSGETLDLLNDASNQEYKNTLKRVKGLEQLVKDTQKGLDEDSKFLMMEFALHGLAEYSQLSKKILTRSLQFSDILSGMFNMPDFGKYDDDDDFNYKKRI